MKQKVTTFATDNETRAAIATLKSKGYNVSAYIRQALLIMAKELREQDRLKEESK